MVERWNKVEWSELDRILGDRTAGRLYLIVVKDMRQRMFENDGNKPSGRR